MKNRFIVTFLAVFSLFSTLSAQKNDLGSWTMVNARITGRSKWSGFFEAQARSINFYDNYFYYEYKGALLYNLSKDFSLGTGVGNYHTFTEGGNFTSPQKQIEVRVWQQLQMRQRQGRYSFEHRYRVEQRFLNTGYRNRFRYRFMMFAPLNKRDIAPGSLYAYAGEEIFLTNIAPYFERNRVMFGLGHELNKITGLQAGFVRQYDYRLVNPLGRNFFQLSLFLYLNAARPAGVMPATED